MNETTRRIEPVAHERVERRDDIRLPTAWVQRDETTAPIFDGDWLSRAQSRPVAPTSAQGPVLFTLGSPEERQHEHVISELLAYGERGARVYVLAPRGWSHAQHGRALAECPRVLVRRVEDIPIVGVHTGAAATLWIGRPSGAAPWALRLDAEQSAAFRQLFLRMFWHHAIEEWWTGDPQQTKFRPATARPFDVPIQGRSASVRVDESASVHDQACELLYLNSRVLPTRAPTRLWTQPSDAQQEQLAQLASAGVEIVWEDRDLPELALREDGGCLLAKGTRTNVRVELNHGQRSELARVLLGDAAWRFETEVRLGDHARTGARLWLPKARSARAVEPEQVIELDSLSAASLAETREPRPTEWQRPRALARVVRYRWTVNPPRVPKGAKPDPLVASWRALDSSWSARLEGVRAMLDDTATLRSDMTERFPELASQSRGFAAEHKRLLKALARLGETPPSEIAPESARALLCALETLEQDSAEQRRRHEQAEAKAREDAARSQQQAEWRTRVEEAKRALQKRRGELKTATAELETLEAKLAPPSAKKKQGKGQETADQKAARLKLNDELKQQKKTLKRLESELKALEAAAREEFVFKPPARPSRSGKTKGAGRRFVPMTNSKTSSAPVPSESLPALGQLVAHRKQRYLVIESWDELTRGEAEAKRLSAKLVTSEE